MSRFRAFVTACAAFFAMFVLLRSAVAAPPPLDPKEVPEPLKPWTNWVLHGKERTLCPSLHGDSGAQRCAWPSRLELSVDERGGHFSQTFHLDAREWVALPGDDKRWPQEVQVDGKRAVVATLSSGPSVELTSGDHVVTGVFLWDSPPESLRVPPETGLVGLTLRGARIDAPNVDAAGTVWLQKTAGKEEGEKLEFVVHRRITDDVPLLLATRIELNVSGKSREVLLGKALPAGFVPMSLEAPLPARVEPDGRLRVQLRAGTWTFLLVARGEGMQSELRRPEPGGPWREGEEVWVFEAKSLLRLVSVEGVSAIDPQQTSLPDDWKRLPAYPMGLKDTLRLVEKRRGDSDPPPPQLTLARKLWLDFDGSGYTVSDTLTGNFPRDTRLEMAPPTVLGRVAMGGADRFITHLAGSSLRGVEIRQGSQHLSADSRIPGPIDDIPAVGWESNFHQVSGVLHLPPGWRLFHASGVDDVPSTWVRHWSLFELFLVLVASLAVARLYGIGWGAVTLVMMTLVFPENDAPKWSWLVVLAAEALVRVLPEGRARTVFSVLRLGALVALSVVAIPFLVQHVREGMYPILAHSDVSLAAGDNQADNKEGGTGMRAKGEEGSMGNAAQLGALQEQAAAEAPKPELADGVVAGEKQNDERNAPAQRQMSRKDKLGSSSGVFSSRQFNAYDYDPNVMVQTGPGLPHWGWTHIDLRWSGPVEKGQRLRLLLLSPWVNRLLAFVRAALLILIILRLFPWIGGRIGSFRGPAKAAATAAAALALLFSPTVARAGDIPDSTLLSELGARLLRAPECMPSCASTPRLRVVATPSALELRLEVDAIATTAVPIPASPAQWLPQDVYLDGRPARALLRHAGKLYVAIDPGSHQIIATGPMPARETFQLPLPLKPHRVEVQASGWTVDGVHEDGLADENVQFTRTGGAERNKGAALQPSALPPFVRIERTLIIGLNWQVETRIVRLSPPGSAIVLEVPLLAGESVTTADVRVNAGKAQVNMAPSLSELSWRGVLEQKSPIALRAAKELPAVELWRVDIGPLWHGGFRGIPSIHAPTGEGRSIPEWRPWPGEEAVVEIVRPDGVPGQTLTIDNASYELRPGIRATDATLSLSVRSGRGAEHVLTLPDGATLESVSIRGQTQPIRQDGRKVTLPIVPGSQTITVKWRQPLGVSLLYRAPDVALGAASVNATVRVMFTTERWLLWLGGPSAGPNVLFWSLFVVLGAVAFGLGRIRWTPIKAWQWLLLAIGLSQVHVIAGAFVVGWLVVLGWRKERPELGVVSFNLRQVLVVLWTLIALVLLLVAIHHGLLGQPEMQLQGNDSSPSRLEWFQDRCENVLPAPWIISVPMLAYRGAMLGWALWLALSVLGWLRWGWQAFTSGGGWKHGPKRPPPPPRPVTTPQQPPYPQPPCPQQQPYPPQPYQQPYPQQQPYYPPAGQPVQTAPAPQGEAVEAPKTEPDAPEIPPQRGKGTPRGGTDTEGA